jgi:hypothetical protein
MYLYTRTGRLRPSNVRDAMAWAVGITEKVNQITSLEVGLWTTRFSPASGTLVWSTFVEDLTALETANAKLMVDDSFIAESERGAQFASENGLDDEVAQLIHGEIDPSRSPKYAAAVRSEMAPGAFAKGVEVGVEIAQRATQISGVSTAFLLATTGTYGGVRWITAAETLEELEQAEQAVNGDAGFVQYVDSAVPGVYLPGITTQSIYERIA